MMKIKEYISSNFLNNETILRASTLEKFVEDLPTPSIIHLKIDSSYEDKIEEALSKIKDSVLVNLHFDFDFPIPKHPFSYINYKEQKEYLDIPYPDRVNKNVIKILEENNLHVFSTSVSVLHPRITFIPLGVFWGFNHFNLKTNEKTQLCYANFGLGTLENNWFGYPRPEAFKIIQTKPFIKIENVCSQHSKSTVKKVFTKTKNGTKTSFVICQNGGRNTGNLDSFYEQISKSKFAICPRGCGIDTYRLWDCIVLGCIPIVERYESHAQFEDLPIYFIDNIQELDKLTPELLEKVYDDFQQRSFNYAKLQFTFWKDKILQKSI